MSSSAKKKNKDLWWKTSSLDSSRRQQFKTNKWVRLRKTFVKQRDLKRNANNTRKWSESKRTLSNWKPLVWSRWSAIKRMNHLNIGWWKKNVRDLFRDRNLSEKLIKRMRSVCKLRVKLLDWKLRRLNGLEGCKILIKCRQQHSISLKRL